ncbi:MAG: glycosyltransferase family 39 protein [Solirubrobacterales bacterium]
MSGSAADADPTRGATSDRGEVAVSPPGDLVPDAGGSIQVAAPGVERGRLRSVLRDRAEPLALVGITALAAVLRFSTLNVQSFDHDEAVTAILVLHPSLVATLGAVAHLERNPPLYYMLAWGWSKGFGTGQDDLRLLSAIFGTLTVPAAFLAARELASRRAGLIAAALVALNPFLIWYSQEARSYALMVMFATVGLFMFARARRVPSTTNLALWALASMLALLSHYFAVFVIVPEAVLLIALTRARVRTMAAVAATAAVGLALFPLAIVQQSGRAASPFATEGILERGWQIPVHFAASAEPPIPGSGAVGLLQVVAGIGEAAIALAAIAILWRAGARDERRSALVVVGIAVAAFAVPIVLAAGGFDFVNARNMIATLVPLLVALGIAFGCARAGRLGIGAAAATCSLFAVVLIAVNLAPRMQRPDWRGAAQAIGPAPASGMVVTPALGQVPISSYLGAKRFKFGAQPMRVRNLDLLSKGLSTAPPPGGFRLVGESRVAQGRLWLRRFRSLRPVSVGPPVVPSSHLIAARAHRWHFVAPARLKNRG